MLIRCKKPHSVRRTKMDLEDAFEKVGPGGSVEQTIWTQNPGFGIEPSYGVEYQVKIVVTPKEDGSYVSKLH